MDFESNESLDISLGAEIESNDNESIETFDDINNLELTESDERFSSAIPEVEAFSDIENQMEIEDLKQQQFEELTKGMNKESLLQLKENLLSYEEEAKKIMELDESDDEGDQFVRPYIKRR